MTKSPHNPLKPDRDISVPIEYLREEFKKALEASPIEEPEIKDLLVTWFIAGAIATDDWHAARTNALADSFEDFIDD